MKDSSYKPTAEYRFWLYDPEGNGMTYWHDKHARDAAADLALAGYLDGEWSDQIEYVSAGEVTHTAQMLNKRMRPDNLDENQHDEDGMYWGDFECVGNYQLTPISAGTWDAAIEAAKAEEAKEPVALMLTVRNKRTAKRSEYPSLSGYSLTSEEELIREIPLYTLPEKGTE